LLSRLVAIDSVNPSLVPGAAGEAGIAAFVANELERLGARVAIVPAVKENRPSVLGVITGTGGGRSLLLYSHLDTVGVEGLVDPHRPAVQDDKFFGRGSLDMKGGLASVLLAAKVFARARPAGDVYIAAVSDEESDSAGMEAVLHDLGQRQIHPDAAIVPEPTGMDLCLAHRGFAWITITTRGRAAHTALRADGVNAIAHMGRVLTALEEYDRELLERPAHPLLGHGAATVSLVQGGSELYTCPAHCRIDLVRRTLPGENRETIMRELDALLAAPGRTDPRFSADFEIHLQRAPLETPAESPIVTTLAAMAHNELGHAPGIVGAPYWTDAGLLAEAGIPSVIFGPSGEGPHADVEWVSLSSVEALTRILIGTTRTFCS
jgi:acetylornithine deacetylase